MIMELSHDEAELIRKLLERRIDELGPEIHHTRSREYRQELQESRDMLRALLERMLPVPTASG